MLTQLGASLVGLCDSIMVGRYATVDLAAVSFSNALFFTVMVFAMGALMGLTPLVGLQIGKLAEIESGQEEVKGVIASLFQNGMLFTVLLSVLTLVMLGGCIPFLHCFGQDPEVVEVARTYYILIVVSIVPFLLFTFFKQFLEGLGNTSVAMVITLAMNAMNIFLNWLFIYGNWGCPELGATGAGVGSLVARIGMPICFVGVMYFRREWRGYLCSVRWGSFRKRVIRELSQIGFPIGIQTLMETIAFTVAFVIIGWISKEALAAHQIANQLCDMTFMVILGIGSATTIRVSHRLGENNFYGLRMAGKASIHLCLLTNSVMALLMIVFASSIPRIFTTDLDVIRTAAPLIILAGLFQISDGLQTVGVSILRGLTDVRRPVLYAFISYICINLPLGYYLSFVCGLGERGIWIGFIVGLSIAALLYHVRCHRQINKLEKQSSTSI